MSDELTPAQNALDSLNRVAEFLARPIGSDPIGLKEPIAWGWHCIGLLAYLRLRPERQSFDSWIQDYFQEGSPELNIDRDARWEERERLSFLELLDLLSDEDLPSLKPEFYQGWQDRATRCAWLRQQVKKVIGRSLSNDQREKLLLLLAVYHRLVRLPAGVILKADEIMNALPAMLDLMEMLIDKNSLMAELLSEAISKCRQSLD